MTSTLKIAIRPPEYLPRLEYIAHMAEVDVFVLADTFQYSRQSYQNRTWIRTPQGRMWLSIPLEGGQHGRPIRETRIEDSIHWISKHRRALKYNYGRTPFFPYFASELDFFEAESPFLSDVTCASVKTLHRLYGLKSRLILASEVEGCPGSFQEIVKAFEPGLVVSVGQAYSRDKELFSATTRLDFEEPEYRQHFDGFEFDMTALDLLCNYGPEAAGVIKKRRPPS